MRGLPGYLRWGITGLLTWLVLMPLALVVVQAVSFREPAAEVLEMASLGLALRNSLLVSAVSVVTAGAVGIPLAFLTGRQHFPGRRLFDALFAVPVALPPLVGALAYLYFWGESGWLSRLLGLLFYDGEPAWRFYGFSAILVVHTGTLYVYFFLFVRAALARTDPALEEAARSLGAGVWRRFRTVLWPQVQPAVRGAAALTLLTALGSFSAPYLFGGQFRVLPTQILASKQNGDFDRAELETVLLLAMALLLLFGFGANWGSVETVGGFRGGAPAGVAEDRRVGRLWFRFGIAAIAAAILLAPLGTLVLLSFVPPGSWTTELVPPRWDLEGWRWVLLEEPDRLLPLGHSAWMALFATLLALPLGWLAARTAQEESFPGRLKEWLLLLPWAVPATAFALALAVTWSSHQPAWGRFVLVGTPWLLPLAYFLRSLPMVGRAALAGLAKLDPGLEEASRGLGAGWLRTELCVVGPLLRPALVRAALFAFVMGLGDFVVAVVLYSPAAPPISIEILAALRVGESSVAAVLGTLLVLLGGVVFLLSSRWDRGTP